ncbi:hypothetical protein BD779DRAFT_1121605 [Infundibulicybe gibba]|nr:hypothetical protein BD779DRAFT_1121605 [Infundibulicybe gibba]
MANNSASDGFNLFIGALSLVTAISSTILCCRAFLPRVQMRLFIEIMDETKAMLLDADHKGLIRNEFIRQGFMIKIEQLSHFVFLKCVVSICGDRRLEDLGTDLHDEICEARTQFEEHIAALKGLSKAVMQLVGRARYLRSWIAKNAEGRQKEIQQQVAQILPIKPVGGPLTLLHQTHVQQMTWRVIEQKECHQRILRLLMITNARHARFIAIQKPDPDQKHILHHPTFLFGDGSGKYPTNLTWKRRPNVRCRLSSGTHPYTYMYLFIAATVGAV